MKEPCDAIIWPQVVEDIPEWVFTPPPPIVDKFFNLFDSWVNRIELAPIQKDWSLPIECKYLTFNYTETLEQQFGIPAAHVAHLHGSRLKERRRYVFRAPSLSECG